MKAKWVETDTHDRVVDYVRHWSERGELPAKCLIGWIGIGMSKFHQWSKRHGQTREARRLVPRDHWLAAWERATIVAFHADHPLKGYCRLP